MSGYGGIIVISVIIIVVGATNCNEKKYPETQGGAENWAQGDEKVGASNGMQCGEVVTKDEAEDK